jgi:hypothetical protein
MGEGAMTDGLHRRVAEDDGSARPDLEALIRADFDRCHPGQTLEDIKRRARFSEEDRGLLRDWMALAAWRAEAARANGASGFAAG